MPKVFICHSTKDSRFVIRVVKYLKHCFDEVFYYEAYQKNTENFQETIDSAQRRCDYFLVFVGENLNLSHWQLGEVSYALRKNPRPHSCVVYLGEIPSIPPNGLGDLGGGMVLTAHPSSSLEDYRIAHEIIVKAFNLPFRGLDGLPYDPNLFSYEKDIINFYFQKAKEGDRIFKIVGGLLCDDTESGCDNYLKDIDNFKIELDKQKGTGDFINKIENIRHKLLNGCPAEWPEVKYWTDYLPKEIDKEPFETDIINKIMANSDKVFIRSVYSFEETINKYVLKSEISPEYKNQLSSILASIGYPLSNPSDEKEISPFRKPLDEQKFGSHRDASAHVIAATLSKYHCEDLPNHLPDPPCLEHKKIYFPEAGPRNKIYFPRPSRPDVNVAILVAGGIAPGINAVIDGIVQRHSLYAKENGYNVNVFGIKNGLYAVDYSREVGTLLPDTNIILLPQRDKEHPAPNNCFITSEHASAGGSIIGTAREDDLIKSDNRENMFQKISQAFQQQFDLLYVIGGDGSMKLAHAIWNYANIDREKGIDQKRLSVIAIPKTMDNDILWMWQSFGFLSAVEKAREIIGQLDTEIKSNPRLCVLQLFGSDSGFVVSHAVAASSSGQCDAALIPEVPFSLYRLSYFLKARMSEHHQKVPSGLIVMAETAIPTDAIAFIFYNMNILKNLNPKGREPLREDEKILIEQDIVSMKEKMNIDEQQTKLAELAQHIDLTNEELYEICKYHLMRKKGRHIQGQTNDKLRSATLKIVYKGLEKLLSIVPCVVPKELQPNWDILRVMTNEPRHILRAIHPTSSDIIMGQRLGTLAVDNAIAGYTDFMISQWLTEFVLVPLDLVVLGRKRIPQYGMFWKSVLAKTGQDSNLDL